MPLRIGAGLVGPTPPAAAAADSGLDELFAGLVAAAAPEPAATGSTDARPQRAGEEPTDPLLLLLQGGQASAPETPTTLAATAITPAAPDAAERARAEASVDPLPLLQSGQAPAPAASPAPPASFAAPELVTPRRIGAVRRLPLPLEQRAGGTPGPVAAPTSVSPTAAAAVAPAKHDPAPPAALARTATASPRRPVAASVADAEVKTSDAAVGPQDRAAAASPEAPAPVERPAPTATDAGPTRSPPSFSQGAAAPDLAPVEGATRVAEVVRQPGAAASAPPPQQPTAATGETAARTVPTRDEPPVDAPAAAPPAKAVAPRTSSSDLKVNATAAEWAPVLTALEEIRSRLQPFVTPGATPSAPASGSAAAAAPAIAVSNVPDLLARVDARFGGRARTPTAAPTRAAAPLAPAAVPAHNGADAAPLAALLAPLVEHAPIAEPLQSLAEAPAPLAEQMVERQLDLAHEGEWLDALARDIARTGASDAPLRFRLHPEYLGTLEVEVRQTADGATVRMTTETAEARAIIADAQPKLVAEARAQGVRIAEAHVDLGQQQAGGGSADPRGREPDAQPRPGRPVQQASTPEPRPARSADLYA